MNKNFQDRYVKKNKLNNLNSSLFRSNSAMMNNSSINNTNNKNKNFLRENSLFLNTSTAINNENNEDISENIKNKIDFTSIKNIQCNNKSKDFTLNNSNTNKLLRGAHQKNQNESSGKVENINDTMDKIVNINNSNNSYNEESEEKMKLFMKIEKDLVGIINEEKVIDMYKNKKFL